MPSTRMMETGTTLTTAASLRPTRRRSTPRRPTCSSISEGDIFENNLHSGCVAMLENIYRTVSKSRQNIPAAAGSAEEATTSTVHMNGGGAMNGVSGESDTEDMDVN